LFKIAATGSQSQRRLVDNSIDFRLQVRVFLDQLSLESTNRLRQDGVELKRDTRGSDRSAGRGKMALRDFLRTGRQGQGQECNGTGYSSHAARTVNQLHGEGTPLVLLLDGAYRSCTAGISDNGRISQSEKKT